MLFVFFEREKHKKIEEKDRKNEKEEDGRNKKSMEEKGKHVEKIQSGCNFDCASCGDSGCSHKFYDAQAGEKKEEVKEENKDA